MQSLYALELAKEANYQVALDLINQAFIPDWDEKKDADYDKIAEDKETALQIYQSHFESSPNQIPKHENSKVHKSSLDAIHHYQNHLTRDKNFYAKNLINQIDTIYEIYISILALLIELPEVPKHDREKIASSESGRGLNLKSGNLENNPISKALLNNEMLESEIIKRGVNWQINRPVLQEIYKKILKNDPDFIAYDQMESPDFEDHRNIIKHIIKQTIFKKKTFNQFIVSEIAFDQDILNELLEKYNTTEIFNHIRDAVKDIVQTFKEKLDFDLDVTTLSKTLKSRLDKVYKGIYEDVKFIDTSVSSNLSPRAKSQKSGTSSNKDLETSPLLSQKLIEQSIREMIGLFSLTLENSTLNHVDNQANLTSILIECINFFMAKIDLTWTENTKITLKIEAVRKHSPVNELFEEKDLNWTENTKIIQSMVQNTLKLIQDNEEDEFELASLSKNWEEDCIFYQDLYRKNIEDAHKYEEIIASKSQNWDLSRLALIDKVILKMAICEMINFYSIPVKVSINEYIELSKIYSTVKSKQFINGLLDAISQELLQKRVIKKSGRGLLDNK